MKQKLVLVACSVIYKQKRGRPKWFIVKHKEGDDWEIPKAFARGVESSVRAAIRATGEMGGMKAKVLEEVGRAGGATATNGKVTPVRYLYYLMHVEDLSGEAIGFHESEWVEYKTAIKRIKSKRDKEMLKDARSLLNKLKKENKV